MPEWARLERARDREWIAENLRVFWAAARAAFSLLGRGAIVVDTTSRPVRGRGHPFGYFPQDVVETADDEDTKRMVRGYDPEHELVIVLLKSAERTSTYRVQVSPREQGPPA